MLCLPSRRSRRTGTGDAFDLPNIHHRHLTGHDGSDLGLHLVVVHLVSDRVVHEFLNGLGHDRDDDPDHHRVAEDLSELRGQGLGLFLPLHQLPLDIPQLFFLRRVRHLAHHPDGPRHRLQGVLLVHLAPSSKPFHVLHRPDQLQGFSSQHRRPSPNGLDVFLVKLLGQLFVADRHTGFLDVREDLEGITL